jgi:hypothetical protein
MQGFASDFMIKSVPNQTPCFLSCSRTEGESYDVIMQGVSDSPAETQWITEIYFTFRDIPWCIMSRLVAHVHRYRNFSRLAIFPVRNANFVQTENQFGRTALNVFIEILHCSFEAHPRYVQTLLFLAGTVAWMISSGERRTNEFPQPRVIGTWNWIDWCSISWFLIS